MPAKKPAKKAPKAPAAKKAPKAVPAPAPSHRDAVAARNVNGPGRVGPGGSLVAPGGGE